MQHVVVIGKLLHLRTNIWTCSSIRRAFADGVRREATRTSSPHLVPPTKYILKRGPPPSHPSEGRWWTRLRGG